MDLLRSAVFQVFECAAWIFIGPNPLQDPHCWQLPKLRDERSESVCWESCDLVCTGVRTQALPLLCRSSITSLLWDYSLCYTKNSQTTVKYPSLKAFNTHHHSVYLVSNLCTFASCLLFLLLILLEHSRAPPLDLPFLVRDNPDLPKSSVKFLLARETILQWLK